MNKGKKSILNAVAALIQMASVSLIGLVLTKSIISRFGSEYNGMETVSENGFATVSCILALYLNGVVTPRKLDESLYILPVGE